MDTLNIDIERGLSKDAEAISALAIQVFLDTYATDVRPDLAPEALSEYSQDQFHRRLSEPNRMFLLAKRGDGIIGFAEFTVSPVQLPGQDERG